MGRPALQVIQGDKAIERALLRELYSKYGGSVFGRCHYLLKDRAQAEDAMQDVFARALQNLNEFRSESSPLTWLMKIATHHCLNLLRSERASWRGQFEAQERTRPVSHGGPQVVEVREAMRLLLASFDSETQAAVIHYHLDEMTLEEVARLLKRSIPTIRKRLQNFAKASGKEFSP